MSETFESVPMFRSVHPVLRFLRINDDDGVLLIGVQVILAERTAALSRTSLNVWRRVFTVLVVSVSSSVQTEDSNGSRMIRIAESRQQSPAAVVTY